MNIKALLLGGVLFFIAWKLLMAELRRQKKGRRRFSSDPDEVRLLPRLQRDYAWIKTRLVKGPDDVAELCEESVTLSSFVPRHRQMELVEKLARDHGMKVTYDQTRRVYVFRLAGDIE